LSGWETLATKYGVLTLWAGMLLPLVLGEGLGPQERWLLAIGWFCFGVAWYSGFGRNKVVFIAGDALLVSNGLRTIVVPLCSVVDVRFREIIQPPLVTVVFDHRTRFGSSISFLPAVSNWTQLGGEERTVAKLSDAVTSAKAEAAIGGLDAGR
jgi:hypothetical protein